MELNHNPENFFAEVEQAANPADPAYGEGVARALGIPLREIE